VRLAELVVHRVDEPDTADTPGPKRESGAKR
jgi:hypothetical protein